MKAQEEEDILSIPTFVLGVLSLFSCLYVIISSTQLKRKHKNENINDGSNYSFANSNSNNKSNKNKNSPKENAKNNFFHNDFLVKSDHNVKEDYDIVDIINWMSIADFLYCGWTLLNFTSQAIGVGFPWNHVECIIIGIIGQFAALISTLSHMLIAYCLLYLLKGYKLANLQKQKKYHIITIFMVSMLCTFIPLIFNSYGTYLNVDDQAEDKQHVIDEECWLTTNSNAFQLTLYIPITITLLFHYVVFLYTLCKKHPANFCNCCNQNQYNHNNNNTKSFIEKSYDLIVNRLMLFVIVFSVIRLPSIVDRMYALFEKPPLFLIICHHISIASVGIGDGLVWYCGRRQKNSYYDYYNLKCTQTTDDQNPNKNKNKNKNQKQNQNSLQQNNANVNKSQNVAIINPSNNKNNTIKVNNFDIYNIEESSVQCTTDTSDDRGTHN